MGFDLRLSAGVAFEQEVERYLQSHPDIVSVTRNGTEHTHPEFIARLRSCSDPTAQFIRFAPDGVALSKSESVFHWEAKCSYCIERDAYEVYLRHLAAGCDVLLFLKTELCVFAVWVSQLEFLPSEEVVGRYPPACRFPVEEGWISPRKAKNRSDLRIGSGTPYQEVNLEKCLRVMTFAEWQVATS